MVKFGELINEKTPVLLGFYAEWNEHTGRMTSVLHHVAAALGDKLRILKVDVDKNKELTEGLKIKGLPTLIFYKNREMKWRYCGEQDANSLINILRKYI